ncbi:MAG TPA: pitrilysin family protein [Thermoanaerobaculia bacterium]|nr:pitrilysin family protein [Thermoanaerobaculia bacterium]
MRARIVAAVLLTAAVGQGQQTTPPAPAEPRQATLPAAVEKTLDNGLRVIVVTKHDVPLVSARLMVKAGSEADQPSLGGLASLTASLLTQGTATRSAEQIARGVEALGATLDAGAGWDASNVSVTVLSNRFAEAMTFVADVVRNPSFKPEEIERLRGQSIDAVRVSLQEPLSVAQHVAARIVFPGEPYGHTVAGTPESLERIQREQIAAFHERYYRPENAVLVVAGDVKPAAAFATAGKLFGSWRRRSGALAIIQLKKPAEEAGPRVVVIDMPDAGQAAVLVTRRGLRRVDPLYYPAIVANSVLGGSYSARLNQEIRIKRGLSYGANSSFDLRREPGPFTAATQTKNESAAEVAGIIVDELHRLATVELPRTELGPRKAVLTGNFGRSLETTEGIVGRIAALVLYGLPLKEIEAFVPAVQNVTGDAVKKFAASHLAATSIVIVGNASEFLEPLRKRFGEVEVIPIEELDLEAPALRTLKDAA